MKERNESPLELFCKSNAEKISHCNWKDSKYCLKTCKYYKSVFQIKSYKEK